MALVGAVGVSLRRVTDYQQLQLRIGDEAAARLLELSQITTVSLETWAVRWDELGGDREMFERILAESAKESRHEPPGGEQ